MSGWNEPLDRIKPYTVASHKIWMVPAEERSSLLKLDWNEAAVTPSPSVRTRILALLEEEDFLHLYPSTDNVALMHALSGYIGLPAANIHYFVGSDALHEYLARCYMSPGDHILLLWPSYDNFRLTAESTGARLFYAELGQDFAFDEELFLRRIDSVKPRLVYLCNPNNPTGTLLPPETIEKLLIRYPETVFLVDEAYAEFAEVSVKNLVLRYENLLITRTLSKAFGLANLRFGYLLASEKNIAAVAKVRNPKCINTITQAAAQAALEDAGYMRFYVKEVIEARDYFIRAINEGPLSANVHAYESRGNFVLLRMSSPEVKTVLLRQWETDNIFVRDVRQSESLENCVRVTVGTKSQMERVIASASLAICP